MTALSTKYPFFGAKSRRRSALFREGGPPVRILPRPVRCMMVGEEKALERKKHIRQQRVPRVGMRIIKTGLSVMICLIINYFISPNIALISTSAACVTMQATLADSKNQALSQIAGTLIGGGMACAVLPLALNTDADWLYLLIMPLGCMLGIYLCILFGLRGSATICTIVYIFVLVTPYNNLVSNPFAYALSYVGDTLVGVVVALLVNRFVKPPRPRPVVHLETNTYAELLDHIQSRITGSEQLILLNSDMVQGKTLYNPSLRWRHRYIQSVAAARIAVPQEYSNFHYISCVYVTWGYKTVPLFLKQTDGYISLPPELYPVTVIWPVHEADRYGIKEKLLHPSVKGTTQLPDPAHPDVLRKDPIPDTPASRRRLASDQNRRL